MWNVAVDGMPLKWCKRTWYKLTISEKNDKFYCMRFLFCRVYILFQPYTEDEAYTWVLKKCFYLKEEFIFASLTCIWKILMPVLCKQKLPGDLERGLCKKSMRTIIGSDRIGPNYHIVPDFFYIFFIFLRFSFFICFYHALSYYQIPYYIL